jgi:transketolase
MNNKATRDAFGDTLLELGAQNKNLIVVDCDLGGATKANKFRDAYPERFFQFGIQEANAISAAAGLAISGFRPFISSFSCFITGRYDQIRISIANNKAPIVIVGTHGGLAIGKDGATQMGLEDINLMRGLPNMIVIQPADYPETVQVVRYLAKTNSPAFLRLCRQSVPNVNDDDYVFEFGKGVILKEGNDLAIFATGGMVYVAKEVADELAATRGINARVINIHTIKPIDRTIILKAAKETKALFTLEDHNIIGGLGTAVSEVMAEEGTPVKVKRFGVKDVFGESGDSADLYKKHRLDKESLVLIVSDFYKEVIKNKNFN